MTRFLWFIAISILAVSAWILFNLNQDLDEDNFTTNIRASYTLLTKHESLIESVLQVYGRSNKHYDNISDNIQDLRELQQQLYKSVRSSPLEEVRELTEIINLINKKLAQEIELIEDFKTHNALMLNSIMFLPRIGSAVLEEISPYMATERRDVRQLMNLTMQAHLLRSEGRYKTAQGFLLNLEHRASQLSDEATRKRLRNFCDHVTTVLDYSRSTDELLADYEIIEDEVDDLINKILNRLLQLEQQAINRIDIHKSILAIIALGLLFLATLAFIKNFNSLKKLRIKEEERNLAYTTLNDQSERTRITLESIADGVITTDIQGRIEYINPEAEKMTGWEKRLAKKEHIQNVAMVIDEGTRHPIEDPVARCLMLDEVIHISEKTILINKHSKELAIELSVSPIRDYNNQTVGTVIAFRDVSVQRILKQELSWQATHDSLTGLSNRSQFEYQVDHIIAATNNTEKAHCLLFIDLDNFKIVNDTAGHIAGDEVLRNVSITLDSVIREADTLARLGGDEFGVLLENCQVEKGLEIANSIIEEINQRPFIWGDNQFHIGASIGLVSIDQNSQDINQILSSADLACYAAKDDGRNKVHIYHHNDEITGQRRSEMEQVSLIRKALDNQQLVLYRQAVFRTRNTDDIYGYEILLRMQEEGETNLLPPDEFIPAAERYNMMQDIDLYVIEHLFEYISECRSSSSTRYFINLSGQSFNNAQLSSFIQKGLIKYDIDPDIIFFEITETAVISNMIRARHLIDELMKIGCHFSLDDFGTGLSSYAYLRYLPVEHLKIDGNFVRDMVHDTVNEAIVRSITELARSLELETVAEMVEDEETLQALKRIGVDYAQGYYTGLPEPLPAPTIY